MNIIIILIFISIPFLVGILLKSGAAVFLTFFIMIVAGVHFRFITPSN